jgi:hypothetical protein
MESLSVKAARIHELVMLLIKIYWHKVVKHFGGEEGVAADASG